ncbi:DUF1206 domain-containing protein [Bacillus sp. ISL-47]|uniref:DUF1206 domain-containing protein n=1 Tax=Bacillus sp. ISL-47 TaxID=2819130 RepID=UPI001BE8301F|nr:DUF1206 domain-containing protein [Pseudomonas sp. ISL-84]
MELQESQQKKRDHRDKLGKESIPWLRRYARLGYMARGFVYMIIGILAMMAAAGAGGSKTDTGGALRSVATVPFGEALLWGVAFSLSGYVLWRIILIINDPEKKGFGIKGIALKISYLISGIIYASLSYEAFTIANHASSGSSNEKSLSAKLLQQPFGHWLAGIAGIIIIGYGFYEMYNAYSGKYKEEFREWKMSKKEIKLAAKAGKIGLTSRAVVMFIIGYFVIITAITSDPDTTIGMDGALAKISAQPFGQILLGVVAFGLFLYGVYLILKGRYRKIKLN